METGIKPFIAAYYVLKILRENGAQDGPTITLSEDGIAVLTLNFKDYNKVKGLAQELLKSTRWCSDVMGNYLLVSEDGLKEETAGNRG